jgi:hypothetical protein
MGRKVVGISTTEKPRKKARAGGKRLRLTN